MEIKNNKIFKYPLGKEMDGFVNEIYNENEYDRFGIKVEKGDIVLDAGANVGIFTQYALDMGASQVLAYECNESLFECYNENITSNRANCTMGFVCDVLDKYDGIPRNTQQYNLFYDVFNKYDLPKIFKQHNINKIDFAKIDIEGCEWEFFEKMEVDDMKKINKWAIEFHTLQNLDIVSEEDKKIKLSWLLNILEKFSVNGFNIKYECIHKGWDIVHLYASKENK